MVINDWLPMIVLITVINDDLVGGFIWSFSIFPLVLPNGWLVDAYFSVWCGSTTMVVHGGLSMMVNGVFFSNVFSPQILTTTIFSPACFFQWFSPQISGKSKSTLLDLNFFGPKSAELRADTWWCSAVLGVTTSWSQAMALPGRPSCLEGLSRPFHQRGAGVVVVVSASGPPLAWHKSYDSIVTYEHDLDWTIRALKLII